MLSRWRLGLVCGMLVAGSAIAVWATGRPFPDVPADHPQASDIARAKAEGWFLGKADGTFGLGETLTEWQSATVLARAFPELTREDMASFMVGGIQYLERYEKPLARAERFVALASGDEYSCAVRSDGQVTCWGLTTTVWLSRQTVSSWLSLLAWEPTVGFGLT